MAATGNPGGHTPETVKTVCNMCMNHCGIDVRVEDGKIAAVKGMDAHPFHHLCIKPAAYPELIHSDKRLMHPLKKTDGGFEQISWDEAFTIIVDRLARIKQQYGAKSLVAFSGNGHAVRSTTRLVRRFADAYGTPNFITGGWLCFGARVMASHLTMGTFPNPDYSEDNRCMVVWGKNPPESAAPERHDISLSGKRGTKLIVVDPKATLLAKGADIHAQLRPGTDCALALGLLNVIINEDRYDKAFVAQWTVGFDKLAAQVQDFPPERVEEITWVAAETVRHMARMYTDNHPASVSLGVALDDSTNGIQTMRAINALMAICGNLEISGGNLSYPGLPLKNLNLPEQVVKDTPLGVEFPLFTKLRHHQSGTRVTHAMVTGNPYPVKGMLVIAGNPLVNWPNSHKVRKAFEQLDFLVVADMFMTDTAKMADIILPAASDLESEDIRSGYFDHNCLPLVLKSNRVIEPVGGCMEDWKICVEIGRRMGFSEYFPWEDSDALNKALLEPSGVSLEELEANPGGIRYAQRKFRYYLDNGFKTPSKKVELYSELMARHGYDPVPTFHEPVESPVSRPDLVERYPFILTTGARTGGYTHSRYREIERLRKRCPEPLVEINLRTGNELGIKDGDRVSVESLRGRITVTAKLTADIPPPVISMASGWSNDTGANVNCLTDDTAVDPVSGYPEFRALLCRVAKV